MIEWYLLKPPHVQLSGFEEEALSDFGQEGFGEALDGIGIEVEIFNYDLSERKVETVVIQGVHTDTKLNAMKRTMLAPIGTCKAGMYVRYKNRFWLIINMVDDNQIYEKAILLICNTQISWVNDHGEIVQRWANVESASQYNNGETNVSFFFVRSDQLMCYAPDDDETLKLNSGQRFIVDKRCKMYEDSFDESTTVSLGNTLNVYQLTRSDTILDNYIDSGIVGFIFSQDEQRPEDGYYVIDGKGYWLCGIEGLAPIDVVDDGKTENKQNPAEIISDTDVVYIGLEPAVFKAVFHDENGNTLDASTVEYELYAVFNGERLPVKGVEMQQKDNVLMVSTDDYKLANKSFDVVLEREGYDVVTKTIKFKEFI